MKTKQKYHNELFHMKPKMTVLSKIKPRQMSSFGHISIIRHTVDHALVENFTAVSKSTMVHALQSTVIGELFYNAA